MNGLMRERWKTARQGVRSLWVLMLAAFVGVLILFHLKVTVQPVGTCD